MNKILFGGSFDPIHLGHISMAEAASKQFDANVIFLPSKISVWKNDSAPIEHKIKMIELSIKDYPRFSIDLFEVEKDEEQNYSIDTVNYFINKYPNDTFFYLIGTDHVNAFHKWKQADEIAKKVHIIFFPRPNYDLDKGNIQKFKMQEVVGEYQDISSTEIRSLKALYLNKQVIDYIVSNNLYFMPKIREYLKDFRLNHCISVASLAYDIAKKHGLEHPERAYIAGLLHDIGKEIDQKPIMMKAYKEDLDLPRFAYHQFASEYIAKEEFKIVDQDILEAIKYHATGKDNMCTLGKIIYAADKIEPTRGYDSTEYVDAMMKDIDEGFKIVLKANKEFLEESKGDINNRLTYSCFQFYLD
ncbi:MAG: nicotinate (nicotinamide) nucleotide adenylyltransferase [Bacilli bacterium]|nr:nicotinate (nicotinamide) nucleotide adenylyltransferase [Bacilli bacterium]